ncbi:MAG: Cys-Xaa-Xaa-Xaa repeat radical SAM target protein [Spirochaetales bacterium]|nr:Cys-Xaa-Xaa-Xaa repeat radical SAM target protein [Spirochaetales bacterium]
MNAAGEKKDHLNITRRDFLKQVSFHIIPSLAVLGLSFSCYVYSSCHYACTGDCKGSCEGDCSGTCLESCADTCVITCAETCETACTDSCSGMSE